MICTPHLSRVITCAMFIACLVKRRPKSERREWEEQVRIGEEEEEEASRSATRNFWVDLCPFARPHGLRRDRLRGRGLQNDANDLPTRSRAGAAPGRAVKRARSSHVSAVEEDCSPPGGLPVGRGLSQFQAYCLPLPLLHLLLRLRNGKTHFQELIRRGRTRREEGTRAAGRTPTSPR